MALKDWVQYEKNEWKNKNTKQYPFSLKISKIKYEYKVYFTNFKSLSIVNFKSKSQALKFAKSYMRTH